MSKEIKTSMRKKNRLYKKYISNGCNADDMICLNSSGKDNHYKNWSILNGFLGKAKIPMIPPPFVNNSFETDFLKKANIFNNHFANQLYLIMTAFCLS